MQEWRKKTTGKRYVGTDPFGFEWYYKDIPHYIVRYSYYEDGEIIDGGKIYISRLGDQLFEWELY